MRATFGAARLASPRSLHSLKLGMNGAGNAHLMTLPALARQKKERCAAGK